MSLRAGRRGKLANVGRLSIVQAQYPVWVMLALWAGAARGEFAESEHVYPIVVQATVPALPEPLREFFDEHRTELGEAAGNLALVGPPQSGARSKEPGDHFILLDAAAGQGNFAERHEAAKQFPHDRRQALHLFERAGVQDGGALPWVIEDRVTRLTDAFRAGGVGAIVRQAGELLHFATDASMPPHVRASRGANGRESFWYKRIGELETRLAYEVRVAPSRYVTLDDPRSAIFEVLVESHAALGSWWHVADGERGASVGSEDGAAGLLEARLEAAALLSARLIGLAWTRAGRPEVGRIAGSANAGNTTASAPAPDADLVGSRASSIFHRASCSHARRIAPANLVTFSSVREATGAGRTPCRTCKPTNP